MIYNYRLDGIPKMTQNVGCAGSLPAADLDYTLRQLITGAIRRSPKKRPQIAEELTGRLGVRITEGMLNDFTSQSKKAVRFPLAFSAALCEILDDDSIGLLGVRPRTRKLVELAEKELASWREQHEREVLRDELLNGTTPESRKKERQKP